MCAAFYQKVGQDYKKGLIALFTVNEGMSDSDLLSESLQTCLLGGNKNDSLKVC